MYNKYPHGTMSTLEKVEDPFALFGSVWKVWGLATIPSEAP